MISAKQNHKIIFRLFSLFIIITFQKPLFSQITIAQSEFLDIFTPDSRLYVIQGESGLINIGDNSGPNIYDFTFVNMQDTMRRNNYSVNSIPILAERYLPYAHTFGLNPQNIQDNPVIYSGSDSSFFIGAATIESGYRFTHYVPYELYSQFPVTYESSFSQFIEIWDTTYDSNWQITQAVFYTSQQEMTVDGFGILRLPGMDLECLRQKRDYADYGHKDFHFITREGLLLVVDHIPIGEPDTGFVNADYSVFLSSEAVGVEREYKIPRLFELKQNYPNPFNPKTNIEFQISDFRFVSLKVFDVLGNEIATLVNEEKSPGTYEVEFNPASSFRYPASGIYFYRLRAGTFVEARKMVLIR
ncbi:MAG: T9SS type A sorting domain-containing protein [Ignavibacterium sp.]|nr:T9SS type A sorting domain-containing protein [Ignavibacterium sp.]